LLASSQHNLYDIHVLLCVQYYPPNDGQRNCPKHVEFYSKNKFEKLVHFIGFIVRIYHDARSSEYQISDSFTTGAKDNINTDQPLYITVLEAHEG
jgi:hypothetical protein